MFLDQIIFMFIPTLTFYFSAFWGFFYFFFLLYLLPSFSSLSLCLFIISFLMRKRKRDMKKREKKGKKEKERNKEILKMYNTLELLNKKRTRKRTFLAYLLFPSLPDRFLLFSPLFLFSPLISSSSFLSFSLFFELLHSIYVWKPLF